MTPETMPTDEKENLIAATEENVRYWTQRIMDELEEPWTAQRISQVIRELLTADTNESVVTSLRAEVEGLKERATSAERCRDEFQKRLTPLHSNPGAVHPSTGAIPSTKSPGNVEIGLTVHCRCGIWTQDILVACPQLAKRQWVAFDSIFCELERATNKFPTWPTDPHHAANVLAEEVGELVKTIVEHTYEPHKSTREDVRTEAKQAAAMALRFFLSMDAYQFKPCDQHSQSGKMPIPPTQEPATAETCPTCGSADKSVRESMSKPNCGPPLFPCQDAWHTPDPLALVKAHHAKGGIVQWQWKDTPMHGTWFDFSGTEWSPEKAYRIYPDDIAPVPAWVPKFRVGDKVMGKHSHAYCGEVVAIRDGTKCYEVKNGDLCATFQEDRLTPYTWTLPEGGWHRVDGWREEWLQDGWRPLLEEEKCEEGDEIFSEHRGPDWRKQTEIQLGIPAHAGAAHQRTRRPLPSPPKVEMPKIKTRFIHPPIPIRNFDWEATRDGYDKGDPIGFGRTEELAKADLLEQEEAR
jgi:hypothetical protein